MYNNFSFSTATIVTAVPANVRSILILHVFLFSTKLQTSFGTHSTSYSVIIYVLWGIKRPGRESNHAIPLGVDIKSEYINTLILLLHVFWA